ncbi:AAA family ATPase [Luminiphilus sp.]|nr:AAA family ATPase [Luminiphilus sp.]
MSKTLTARRWLLHDILPPTLTTLAADKGVGKSWAAAALALQTAFPHTEAIAGIAPTPRRKVIWNLESGQAQLDNMLPGLLHEYGITAEELDEWVIVYNAQGADPTEWAKSIREQIDADPEQYIHEGLPPLILVDTLSASFNTPENESDKASGALVGITDNLTFKIGDVEECPVCIIGHTVKENGGRGASMRGSGAWEGNSTHNLQLRYSDPEDKGSPRVLVITKNRMGEQDVVAAVTYLDGLYEETLPCTYGMRDEIGAVMMIDTTFMIIKGATRKRAEEMGLKIGRASKGEVMAAEVLGLKSILPFKGSQNAMADAWQTKPEEAQRSTTERRATIDKLKALVKNKQVLHEDGTYTWNATEDEKI